MFHSTTISLISRKSTVNLERSHLTEGVVDSRIVTVEVIYFSICRYSDSKAEQLVAI